MGDNDEMLVKYICNFMNCDYESAMGDKIKKYVRNNPFGLKK